MSREIMVEDVALRPHAADQASERLMNGSPGCGISLVRGYTP